MPLHLTAHASYARAKPQLNAHAVGQHRQPLTSMRILFVENHAVFAQTVASTFLAEHSVEVVPTVSAALAAVGAREYDAALVDYDLDDGKGDEFVARLRESGSRTWSHHRPRSSSGHDGRWTSDPDTR
jgi:PleD family two-component response regulator